MTTSGDIEQKSVRARRQRRAVLTIASAVGLSLGSTLVFGASNHAAAQGAAVWIQTMDSCRQAFGSAQFAITNTAKTFSTSATTPPGGPTSVGSGSCPLPSGNCSSIHTGCVQVGNLPFPDTYKVWETAMPPANPSNPQGFAPCEGGSACQSQIATVTIDGSGAVSGVTTNIEPDGHTQLFPPSGTSSGTASNPLIFHDFGLGTGSCDGDGDADDHLTGTGPGSHCAYPEAAEASACQPYPWSCGLSGPPPCTTCGTATHLAVTGANTTSAGSAVSETITALDSSNNKVGAYTGSRTLTWSGPARAPNGTAPRFPTNPVSFTSGSATVSVTLYDAQTTALAVSDGSIKGQGAAVSVAPGSAAQLSAQAPASTTAGSATSVSLSAVDAYGNAATSYSGGRTLGWSGPSKAPNGMAANFPANPVSFSSGAATVTVILFDAQSTALSVGDGSISGRSGSIAVAPAGATQMSMHAPATAAAGGSFKVSLSAYDAYLNLATAYAGKKTLTWSGPSSSPSGMAPSYPANPVSFSAGTATASVTLFDAQSVNLSATDGGIAGVTTPIAVAPGSASQLSAQTPSGAVAGSAFTATVTALDAYRNIATSYAGTRTLSWSGPSNAPDGRAPSFPANPLTFTGGVASAPITLYDAQRTSITIGDGSINGATPMIAVAPGAVTTLTLALPSSATFNQPVNATATTYDAFGNLATQDGSTVSVSSSDTLATFPSSTNLSGGTTNFSVTFRTPGSQSLTVTEKPGASNSKQSQVGL